MPMSSDKCPLLWTSPLRRMIWAAVHEHDAPGRSECGDYHDDGLLPVCKNCCRAQLPCHTHVSATHSQHPLRTMTAVIKTEAVPAAVTSKGRPAVMSKERPVLVSLSLSLSLSQTHTHTHTLQDSLSQVVCLFHRHR